MKLTKRDKYWGKIKISSGSCLKKCAMFHFYKYLFNEVQTEKDEKGVFL